MLFLHGSEVSDRPGLTRWACSQADRIVAVSRYTKQLAIDAGAEESRVRIILPGVDVGAFPPFSAGEREPVIVVVSRLDDRYKGHDVLLWAMPLLLNYAPEARLVVIGEGHLLRCLRSLTESYGTSTSVTFTGALSARERDAWLDRARVFAMPSRIPPRGAGEGFGIAYLEAGAHRLPVVAGAVGGALDSVVDGETGILIDPTDHLALAEALASLLTDSELATRLGDGGRARSESLSWARAAADLERILAEITPIAK